jgi:hypothetical protein
MHPDPLTHLWDTARALPGQRLDSVPVLPIWEDAAPRPAAEMDIQRAALVAWLLDVADHMEPLLHQALQASWDQMKEVPLLSPALRNRAAMLRTAWQGLGRHAKHAAQKSAALEALLWVDAAEGLVELLEQRLTMLAGLRRESDSPELMVNNRAFLDVAAALRAAAKVWA